MARTGSSGFALLTIDGYDLLPAKVQAFAYKIGVKQEKTDGLGDRWEEHTPTGLRAVTITQTGAYFDTAANGIHEALRAAPSSYRTLTFSPAAGLLISAAGALTVNYEVLAKNGNLTRANVGYQISGAVSSGALVQAPSSRTADWNTQAEGAAIDYTTDPSQSPMAIIGITAGNPAVITTAAPHGLTAGAVILISGSNSTPSANGERPVTVTGAYTFTIPLTTTGAGTAGSFVRANSVSGARGIQHVIALAGLTGFVGKVRDSADNVVYADLVTFANVTAAPNSQSLDVAGVVDRYLSFDGNVTGTGSIAVGAGLVRL